jgi:hypothetical protein
MNKNKQRGYMNMDGIAGAITFVGIVILVVGILIGVTATTGIPWLWGVIKPWLHSVTG